MVSGVVAGLVGLRELKGFRVFGGSGIGRGSRGIGGVRGLWVMGLKDF